MEKTNAIGLDANGAKDLAARLNVLLANYSIFYQNTRGAHWHIRGDKFFELHVKFEELYNDLLLKIDEVAERILTLGHTPEHRYSEYQTAAQIGESPRLSDGRKAVESILEAFKSVITIQRGIMTHAQEIGDEGTAALMSDYLRAQEKLVWMYSAFLKQ